MFTGIIETTASVINRTENGISIKRPEMFDDIKIGQSIAVNGACLTVTSFDDSQMNFDVVPETFAKTNLGKAEVVNLERAMPANGRFEGHIVQGHVDGVAKLIKREKEGKGERFYFKKPQEFDSYFVQKGSIALNGVSLTIAKDNDDSFEIAIIPHTLELTNFSDLRVGDEVNLEGDVLLKWMEKTVKK